MFVRKVIEASDRLDKPALLKGIGLDPSAPIDVDVHVSGEAYLDLLEEIAESEEDPVLFHLRAGRSMRCDDYGVLGLALKSAPTLLESYRRFARYGQLLIGTPIYSVDVTDDRVSMRINREAPRYGLQLSNEAAISTFWALSKDAIGRDFAPAAVFYEHEKPGSVEHYENFFGCPVNFGAEFNGLCVTSELADEANRVGDNTIVEYFDQQLNTKLASTRDESSWRTTVRDEVAKALSGGLPLKKDIAKKLGVSDRTLQRRLSSEGLSFQGIVEETQQSLAKQLLTKSRYSLAEVAFMTGFSEQSAFNRAFKRWAGETPGSFRASV